MKKHFLLFSLLFFSVLLIAQNNSSFHVSQTNDSVQLITLDSLWKYSPGDDASRALPTFNDSLWKTKPTDLIINNDEKNYSEIGWFRLHISVHENLRHHPLAIVLSQEGASELYIDGRLIHSFGHPDKERSKEIKFTPNGVPVIFEFGEGESHLIAIRYSNHLSRDLIEKPGKISAGFSIALKDPNTAIEDSYTSAKIINILFTFLASFFITLGFVHVLLYLFYRKQKSNLYYSIFIFLFAFLFLFPLLISNVTGPEGQDLVATLVAIDFPVFCTSLLGFIYSLFYPKIPKKFWIFLGVLALLLLLDLLKLSYAGFLLFGFICTVTISSFVEVAIAIYKKKKGAWVVGSATMSFLLLIIFFLGKNALGFGTGVHVATFDLSGMLILGLVLLTVLSIPVSMSVYLAREFAGTNNILEKKLVEVEALSEKTIDQEKEKQKILETQKEVLEIQVKERTSEIEDQKKVIEEKNKDITDSINYAKRIQEAILPARELKYRIFSSTFVLFKPKDIVSGDFYWFAEKNGKKIIDSCDCTGHGVPGALMSMIGNNLLNQIVNEKGITSPDEILTELNKEVRKALKQGEQSETKDGMDVALITFNSETEIEFAGAQRPLWMIRKKSDGADNALEEVKGDKFSIGGLEESDREKIFTKQGFTLAKEDCVYIFSDGFVDQFGGPDGKKFMSRQFKNLILSNYTKPIMEQESILNDTIDSWKGKREQIDDILVIGIKI